jgi:poly(A) polymerase
MKARASVAGADWLADGDLQRLLEILSRDGELARVAGGAVRNALLGEPVSDIDIATTTLPDETVRRIEAAGFKAVPTGIEHGTVTAVLGGRAFEITTLRADIDTDGRHAVVTFGRDWDADAGRRDFTINALYCEADGTIVDLVGGLSDIAARRLRFIGDAEARIREDYLRILRFFRFFAWYGDGRPDAEGIKASARLKDGLDRLSPERVWHELRRLLSAPDPSRALLWMRQAGVLTGVLPESEKWGIDAVPGIVAGAAGRGERPDPLLRLQAIVPPDPARMAALADRLRLSRAERGRLTAWALAMPLPQRLDRRDLRRKLYGLRIAAASRNADAGIDKVIAEAAEWEIPVLPLSGQDLIAAGIEEGPVVGETLRKLEKMWLESDFALTREALLERLAGMQA